MVDGDLIGLGGVLGRLVHGAWSWHTSDEGTVGVPASCPTAVHSSYCPGFVIGWGRMVLHVHASYILSIAGFTEDDGTMPADGKLLAFNDISYDYIFYAILALPAIHAHILTHNI